MSTPQQPELHRSGRGEADPRSAKTKVETESGGAAAGDGGPVPEENVPGHHPEEEQDKPDLSR